MTNQQHVQNLNQDQAIVLLSLMNNAQDVAGGDFGFIQEAKHYQEKLNYHQFAGHLAHLGQFMGPSYDCSKDPCLETNDIQFTLQEWVWDYHKVIETKAKG
jgi:hypothetical protein